MANSGTPVPDTRTTTGLHDRSEISEVVHRYGAAMHRDDVEAIVRCFTDDAVLDYGHVQMEGQQEIRDYFSRISSQAAGRGTGDRTGSRPVGTMFDRKVTSTPVMTDILIDLDGDSAHCESMCLAIHAGYRGSEGRIVVRGTRNVDEFLRTPAGWRIARRAHVTLWSFEVPGTVATP